MSKNRKQQPLEKQVERFGIGLVLVRIKSIETLGLKTNIATFAASFVVDELLSTQVADTVDIIGYTHLKAGKEFLDQAKAEPNEQGKREYLRNAETSLVEAYFLYEEAIKNRKGNPLDPVFLKQPKIDEHEQ